MQAILEKILNDNTKSVETKSQFMKTILSKIPSADNKYSFIKESLEFVLNQPEEFPGRCQLLNFLLVEFENNGNRSFSYEDLIEIYENHHDLVTIVIFTSFFLRNNMEPQKIHLTRTSFHKKIKKDDYFWKAVYFKEFKEKKLVQEKKALSIAQTSLTVSTLTDFNYDDHFFSVNILFKFFEENVTFCPFNFDMKEVYIKWLLTLRNKTEDEKVLQMQMITRILSICNNNYQLYIACLKPMIEALGIVYTNEDILQSHYTVYNFLEQVQPEILKNLMKPSMVGDIKWDDTNWIKVFKNLYKIGLSDNIGITFMSLSRGFESLKFYQILLKIQEEIIPLLILPLKFEKWRESAFEILKFFVLQGPINSILVPKLLAKLPKTIIEIYNSGFLSFSDDLISFMHHLNIKYMQSSVAPEIEKEYEDLLKILNLDPSKVDSKKFSIVAWTTPDLSGNQMQIQNQRAKQKYRGLMNMGNTCYMNSYIQALFMTKVFRYRILSLSLSSKAGITPKESADTSEKQQPITTGIPSTKIEEEKKDSEVNKNQSQLNSLIDKKKILTLFQTQKLFAFLHSSERDFVQPSFFKSMLPEPFNISFAQQDSSEFGGRYLEQFENCLKASQEEDIIKELFTGEFVSCITCKDCSKQYKKTENFMDIGLRFESQDPQVSYELMDLIHKNFEDLEFKDKDAYFCENCNKHSSLAIKSHKPTRFPPVLILTINRFYFDFTTLQRTKILSYVHIPEEIELTQSKENEISEEIKYDLYGIIVHRGKTLDFGHYYCAAKENPEDKDWILFDDAITQSLEKIDPFEYVKKNTQDAPYILFYMARDYYNNHMSKYKDFKLNLSNFLNKLIEQDNVAYLKETDQKSKLMTVVNSLNVPHNFATGPSNYKKDDDDEDGYSKPNDFGGFNRFIM